MPQVLNIAIAYNDPETLTSLHSSIQQLGHHVCCEATNGRRFLETSKSQRPDLMIVQEYLPDMDGLHAATEAARGDEIPIVLVVAAHDGSLVARRESGNVLAVLRGPIRQSDLMPVIPLVMHRFEQLQALRESVRSLELELDGAPRERPPFR
ncbi:MAG: ANTAR domain-containing response regulator [Planctomycetaceae bacterium]